MWRSKITVVFFVERIRSGEYIGLSQFRHRKMKAVTETSQRTKQTQKATVVCEASFMKLWKLTSR
jgi:choline kinase